MSFSNIIIQDHEKTPQHRSSNHSQTTKLDFSIPIHKSTASLQSLKTCSKMSSLTTQSESVRQQYQIEQLISKNKSLNLKLELIKQHYEKELKSRDEIIFSMSSMMKDRECQFKKLLESQESEKNSIIGRKESEKSELKKKIKQLKSQIESTGTISLVQNLDTEIGHLRKLLQMTEKENKELVRKVNMNDKDLFKKKWMENEQMWADTCFELSLLIDALSKLYNILQKVQEKDCSLETLIKTQANEREDITKNNIKLTIKNTTNLVKKIQDQCMDFYASAFGSQCFLQ